MLDVSLYKYMKMPCSDFSEIRIVEDDNDVNDVIKEIIAVENQEDAFHVLDVGEVVARHKLWLRKIPRVIPYYAVKCNPDPTIIKILATLNGHFDCASKQEIAAVIKHGVSGERIIYANAMKSPSHITFARKVGVNKMTADCRMELLKIKHIFPESKVVIRFRCDSINSDAVLGQKFGCEPHHEAIELIHTTKDLGINLYGFSFHVGSPCGDMTTYERGIQIGKKLIDYARSIGCDQTCLIDIGGGFPGETNYGIERFCATAQFADVINEAVKDIDPSIKIISEPGRYYVTAAVSAAAYLFGKKTVVEDKKVIQMYYVNDGAYGSFIEELLHLKARCPTSLNGTVNNEKYLSTLWGPTCDSFDCILKNEFLPNFNVGDWLLWKDMGAYSTSCSSKFNGFQPPTVFPFMRRKDWKALHAEILAVGDFRSGQRTTHNLSKKI